MDKIKKEIEQHFNLQLKLVTFEDFDKNRTNYYYCRNTCVFKNYKLIGLNLNQNNISDISILENYIDLEFLCLSHNKIKDIKAIRKLNKIERLSLAFNYIENIDALRFCDNLHKLYLSQNKISDIRTIDFVLSKKLPENYLINLSGNPLIKRKELKIEANRNDLELLKNKIDDFYFLSEKKRKKLVV